MQRKPPSIPCPIFFFASGETKPFWAISLPTDASEVLANIFSASAGVFARLASVSSVLQQPQLQVILFSRSPNLRGTIGLTPLVRVSPTQMSTISSETRAFETIWTKSEEFSEAYSEINSYLPQSLQEFTIQINADTVFVTGSASNDDIQQMEDSLNNSQRFSKKIDEISSEGGAGNVTATFTLRSDIKLIKFREITLAATQTQDQIQQQVEDSLLSPTTTP